MLLCFVEVLSWLISFSVSVLIRSVEVASIMKGRDVAFICSVVLNVLLGLSYTLDNAKPAPAPPPAPPIVRSVPVPCPSGKRAKVGAFLSGAANAAAAASPISNSEANIGQKVRKQLPAADRLANDPRPTSIAENIRRVLVNDTEQYLQPIQFPATVESVIIEIGTHHEPEFVVPVADTPDYVMHYIGFEPMVPHLARDFCALKGKGRCHIVPFAVGPANTISDFHISPCAQCSSLLALPKEGPHKSKGTLRVPTLTLDTVLYHLLPTNVDIRLLSFDIQGFDLHGISSLRNQASRSRIATLFMECQDLPLGDKMLAYPEGGTTCGQAVSCITQHWGWDFVGCYYNLGPQEYNCIFINPLHHLSSSCDRPVFNLFGKKHKPLNYPAECPSFFNESRPVETSPLFPETQEI